MSKEIDERHAKRIREYWLGLGADIQIEVSPGREYRTATGHVVQVASIRSNLTNGLPPAFNPWRVPKPGLPRGLA